MGKKFIDFFQDKSFGKKKRPLREAGGQKTKNFLKNISKGHIKMGSANGLKKLVRNVGFDKEL